MFIKEQYAEQQGYKWNLVKGTYDTTTETIEECLVREIVEEVGLTNVGDINLSKVFHYGKLGNPKILFVFSVEYLGTEDVTRKNNKDDEHISDAKWFLREEIQQLKKEDCIADYVYDAINNTDDRVVVARL